MKISRRLILGLSSAIGVGAAQEPSVLGTSSVCCSGPGCLGYTPCKAEPNVCPVCGEKADPYRRLTEAEYYGSGVCLSPSSPDGKTVYAICRPLSTTKKTGPMERIIRCKVCNAAFWQDAEDRPV